MKTTNECPSLVKVFTRGAESTKKILKHRIIKQCEIAHNDGYVEDIKENLTSTTMIEDFLYDLNKGDGNELRHKFKALYSSSALCVNFFGFFKRNLNKLIVLGEGNFARGNFEEKLKTGLKGTSPNLDFYLENENCIIGIESKFLELLTPKQPKFSSSYSVSFLGRLDPGLSIIVNHYRMNCAKTHLDTSQLIKHAIGLLNNRRNRRAKLIYVYWEPLNASEYHEYARHKEQLTDFASRMKNLSGLSFHYFSYLQFYDLYSNNGFFKAHLKKFKNRYLF